jgi:16S rRNA (guanine966-N2)-methyltransferase
MRIIAGTHRGRRIRAPEGLGTRPMLDRVRESLFATLRDWVEGAKVLDLFAGSGSLGLEALSRGAKSVRMVERHRPTLALLAENARALGLDGALELACADALEPAAWRGGERCEKTERWDLIFADPPYPLLEDPRTRAAVLAALERLVGEHLEEAGRLAVHVPRGRLDERTFGSGIAAERRTWGTSDVWILWRRVEQKP